MFSLRGKFRRRLGWLAAIGGAGVAIIGGAALWQASRAVRHAREAVTAEASLAFRLARLDPRPAAGFETIGAPASFRDLARFHGRLYLAGPGGLFEYSPEGAVTARYRPGIELPPAPVAAIAPGVIADSADQELLIATHGAGLVAFNGAAFRQILPDDSAARNLTAVLPLASGRVLLGTEKKGLLVYDGKRLAVFHEAFAGLHITSLAGTEAEVWAGTTDRGVIRWHAGEVDRFSEPEGLPDRHVLSLQAANDTVWAGTAMGIAEFRAGRFERSLAPGLFARAMLAHAESLAVGTMEEGVVEVPLQSRRPRPPRPTAGIEAQVERLALIDDRLYALAADGLYLAGKSAWTPVLKPDRAALADRNIAALDVDTAGRLWVGYFDRGLDVLDAGLEGAEHTEDQHVFCVNRIVHDERVTAVATANGLALFDGAARLQRVLGRADGLIANHVTDVVLERGAMIAATPAGVTFIDGGGARSLYAFHGLVNNHAYALAASGNRLLVGTLGGVSILDGGNVTANFTTANSVLTHNWVSAIAPAEGEWFLGTYGGGVWKLDAVGLWQPVARGFEVNPNAMLATGGAVYAGTLGRGLMVFNRRTGRHYFITEGLPSLNVTALAAGGPYVYIGTGNGLVRVPEGSLVR